MINVIGVRFRDTGKIYTFDPGEYVLSRGMSVIVETSRGVEMGMVMLPNYEVEEESVVQPLKSVIRIAETADFDLIRENKIKEKEAFKICQQKIREHELEMKLVDVEYTFDGSKVLFYFTADGRIDFRELVKDLASVFRMRIELRQIGVRDETKLLGGIGICGRALCCHSYLSEFIPVSIKMAKEQNLSLNPTKISGVCGRLMCCLKNEEDTYEYLNSQLPRIGEMVTVTAEGEEGQVQSVNVLRQRVRVLIKTENDDVEMKEYPVEELDFGPDRKPPVAREKVRTLLPEGGEPAENRAGGEDRSSRGQRRNRENGNRREGENTGKNRVSSGRDRGSRQERAERSERSERADRNERPERGDRADRNERPERGDRADRNERPERGERAARSERGERTERPERAERGGRGDRPERAERGGRGDRPERGNRGERGSRGERAEQNSRGERAERTEQNSRGERAERAEQNERNPRSESPERSSRGERSRQGRRGHGSENVAPAGAAAAGKEAAEAPAQNSAPKAENARPEGSGRSRSSRRRGHWQPKNKPAGADKSAK